MCYIRAFRCGWRCCRCCYFVHVHFINIERMRYDAYLRIVFFLYFVPRLAYLRARNAPSPLDSCTSHLFSSSSTDDDDTQLHYTRNTNFVFVIIQWNSFFFYSRMWFHHWWAFFSNVINEWKRWEYRTCIRWRSPVCVSQLNELRIYTVKCDSGYDQRQNYIFFFPRDEKFLEFSFIEIDRNKRWSHRDQTRKLTVQMISVKR